MFVIISGTNRPGSNTRKVANKIASFYKKRNEEHLLLDLNDLPAELFAPSSYETKPESFKRFSDAILNSTGIVVVSPEYNGGPPGVLKYFIDMLPFPESFINRPVCFVGLAAGMWGALRPIEQLQQIFGYRNAYIYPNRVFIQFVIEAINAKGVLEKEEIVSRLDKQAAGFIEFARKVN